MITTISANFDDFQFLTPILLPNDFTSFGGIFYLDFEKFYSAIFE